MTENATVGTLQEMQLILEQLKESIKSMSWKGCVIGNVSNMLTNINRAIDDVETMIRRLSK